MNVYRFNSYLTTEYSALTDAVNIINKLPAKLQNEILLYHYKDNNIMNSYLDDMLDGMIIYMFLPKELLESFNEFLKKNNAHRVRKIPAEENMELVYGNR